jgi:hypothetical protein
VRTEPPAGTHLTLAAVLVALGVGWVATPAAAQERTPVTIGILTDGPLQRFGELVDQIEHETSVLLENRFEVRIGGDLTLAGDHTLTGIRAALDRLMARVDVVVAVGTMGAQVAADHPALTKPVVAPFVLDPSLQGIPRQGAASGVSNFVYLTRPESRDLATLAEVVAFRRLAVLASAYALAEMPGLDRRIEELVGQAGAAAVVVPVGDDIHPALDAVEVAEADAAYVLPLSQVSSAAFEQLADGLIELGLPSLSWFGETEVRQGILLARRPDSFTFQSSGASHRGSCA